MDLQRQVRRLANEQRDLLSPDALAALAQAQQSLAEALRRRERNSVLQPLMENLVAAAEKWLLPYASSTVRENIKEFFIASALILSITTFFLQLTKIPTGSMQPTLFGITSENLLRSSERIPSPLGRVFDYVWRGVSYHSLIATTDGQLSEIEPPRRIVPFVKKQRLLIGNEWHDLWFPPEDLDRRASLHLGQYFRKGDDVLKLKVVTGDHLLVDRFSFNFRRPHRGEIIVFKTRGIKFPDGGDQDQLYIKRLVALGGERVRISDDQHLVIDGQQLDAATPLFENVYTFKSPPEPNHYFGHVNQSVARRWTPSNVAPQFLNQSDELAVPPNHYLAMGDNTLNSRDSREWGALPQENVIGKCWFVYWPFTERFGWGYR